MIIFFIIALIMFSCGASANRVDEVMLADGGIYRYHVTSVLPSKEDSKESEDDYEVNIVRKYGGQNLFDGDLATAWVEGSEGPGFGEAVFIAVPDDIRIFNIFPGYGKTGSVWKKNNRIKKIRISLFSGISPEGYITEIDHVYIMYPLGISAEIDLRDEFALQTVVLPFSEEDVAARSREAVLRSEAEHGKAVSYAGTVAKIEILEVYKGEKFDDTCISEIFFNGAFTAVNKTLYSGIETVYVKSGDDGTVLIDTKDKKGIVVMEDRSAVFQIAEISADKVWASMIKMPAAAGEGRVETEYLLMNIPEGRIMNGDVLKTNGIQLFSFTFLTADGRLYLDHGNGKIILY